MTTSRCRALLLAVACAFLFGACGSSGYEPPAVLDPEPGGEPPPPTGDSEGAAVYVAAGCGGCHGPDGASGFAVSIACYPADGLDTYVRSSDSPHVGGTQPDWTDEDLSALAVFLEGDGCASRVPASHDVSQDGVLHRTGLADPDASCTPCHGAALGGFGSVPACASCHGGGGALTCTGCHASARGGRRAVVGEFSLASHHVAGDPIDADCRVCHDLSQHKQGSVRLLDVDDPTAASAVVLAADPQGSAAEAAKLEPFCLACHDGDGAGGSAPFSDGVIPPPIDAAAWSGASHHLAERTCFGDGETFGCHASGHGSVKRMLLGPSGGSSAGVTGDTTREEEGFCFACHRDGGEASTDIEAEFGRTTHHLVGSHEQGTTVALECTSCHDPHLATSSQPLRDPDEGGSWTGTRQGFCLTCHDGEAPDGVAFPSTSSGTGFDKSGFAGTTHATELGDDSCLDCHVSHGSTDRALLQARYVVADSNARESGDYAACWLCHASSAILGDGNAFGEYHETHVLSEDLTCAECHDVHGGTDSGEPGLIDFSFGLDSGWWMTLPGSQTLSSAFRFDASTGVGACAIRCHRESHVGDSYSAE